MYFVYQLRKKYDKIFVKSTELIENAFGERNSVLVFDSHCDTITVFMDSCQEITKIFVRLIETGKTLNIQPDFFRYGSMMK
jgi:hypothetical protein